MPLSLTPGGRIVDTDNHTPVHVFELVHADLAERDRIGHEEYGGPLLTFNGRDALQDAYEEALDLAVYLRQAIAERDAHSDGRERHDRTGATNR